MSWTVHTESQHETPPVKGSRFLATVAPAGSPEEARAVVSRIAETHPRANHHCWAFLLSDGTARSSDDGEPSGSAGRPILARIEGREATDIVVVVTRWFGGTKLGVGGLVRAYGGCAGVALDAAEPVPVDVRVEVVIRYGYSDTGAVDSVLSEYAAKDGATDYGAEVLRTVLVEPERVDALRLRLSENTSGRARVESTP